MKNKFESLKKLNVATVLSQKQQKNVLGGYAGDRFIECFQAYTLLGWFYVSQSYDGHPLTTCRQTWPQTTRARISVEPGIGMYA